MIGSNLTRFYDGSFCVWDTESEGLNLGCHRPWQLSYAIATLKDGIQSIHTSYIFWKDLDISDDAARITRFDKTLYLRDARPAQEVWKEFSSILYNPAIRKVAHNGLGFDVHMVSTWRKALGLHPDHSWQFDGGGALDTNALGKAYQKGWPMDISSDIALLSSQHKALNFVEKGLKSSLGVMCGQLGVPYDETRAHDAGFDVGVNWQVARELIFKMEI